MSRQLEEILARLVMLIKDDKELHDAIVRFLDSRAKLNLILVEIKRRKLK